MLSMRACEREIFAQGFVLSQSTAKPLSHLSWASQSRQTLCPPPICLPPMWERTHSCWYFRIYCKTHETWWLKHYSNFDFCHCVTFQMSIPLWVQDRSNSMNFASFICSPTQTHTHRHSCECGLRGLSIGVMVFILYKFYILSPYPKPATLQNYWQFLNFKKHSFVCFLSHLVYGDTGSVLINHVYVVVPMSLHTFVSS